MNAVSPRSEKRRQITPLMWATGGTLLLHAAFLLMVWLWPYQPVKPRETLLEVNLAKEKPKKIALQPTPVPTKPAKKVVVPPPTPKPRPTQVVVPRPTPKPRLAQKPKPVRKPRVAKAEIPTPVPTSAPPPTPVPRPTVAPTPIKQPTPVKEPTPRPTVPTPPKKLRPPKTASPTPVRPTTKANTNSNDTTRQAKKSKGKTPGSGAKPGSPSNSSSAPGRPSAPAGGGAPRRRLAFNDTPKGEEDDTRSHPDATSSSDQGHNSRGNNNETAGAEPGVELPRTHAQRGRRGPTDAPPSSAPTTSKDGTVVNVGPSTPTSSSGGSRQQATGLGNGDDDSGAINRGGLPGAEGTKNVGNAKMGRGDNEAAGTGVSGGTRGSGARGNGKRGRGGSRLAGDPFGGNGGNGGTGNGNGGATGNGIGNGPGSGGTRFTKRGGDGLGNGDGDTDGQFGRGTGPGKGDGQGEGDGGKAGRGSGTTSGHGGADNADDAGSGRSRSRRSGSGHREIEAEDQLGRGIWGGFQISFYQDKSRYPDDIDTSKIQGQPIDWPVFSKFVAKKKYDNLDFNWDENPPVPGVKPTFWSMKATGLIFVPKDDTYTFFLDELDDAGRLYLDDGDPIVNVWSVQKSTAASKGKFLTRGPHKIRIEYVQGPATKASIKLSWSSPSFPKEIVGIYKAPGEGDS
ncbi:hypothetical protein IAD21_05873 [Abditibacteriota bacterium]|nr:hypothetical protein IAD21_05873 [Abditibacteriota bacterium]